MYKLKKLRDGLYAQNHTYLKENLTLRFELKSLYEGKSIERLAKETLGMAYPDEVVYIIDEKKF